MIRIVVCLIYVNKIQIEDNNIPYTFISRKRKVSVFLTINVDTNHGATCSFCRRFNYDTQH